MAHPTLHEEENDALGPGGEMPPQRRAGTRRWSILSGEKPGEGELAEAASHGAKGGAAGVEWNVHGLGKSG